MNNWLFIWTSIVPIIGFAVGFLLTTKASNLRSHRKFLDRDKTALRTSIANLLEDHTELGEARAWTLAGLIVVTVEQHEEEAST